MTRSGDNDPFIATYNQQVLGVDLEINNSLSFIESNETENFLATI